jgi:hypothetical protein
VLDAVVDAPCPLDALLLVGAKEVPEPAELPEVLLLVGAAAVPELAEPPDVLLLVGVSAAAEVARVEVELCCR